MITVLIVDDSRFMRNVVKSYFTEMCIPCAYLDASDGKEAMKQMLEQKIDLVLLDWNMPKMSGIDFLKEVRAMERFKELPIVMVTSESAKFNVIEAAKSGATDYILKPIDGTVFREKMKEIFNL
jgi:two-component system chemotaxis response regulator CheY